MNSKGALNTPEVYHSKAQRPAGVITFAVARVDGRMAYVTLDDSNELHAYYRMDDHNVKDAGKVKLRTNKPVGAHYLSGGATGRLHIHLTDFDLDGAYCPTV
eukprot:6636593-Pyramimonas_sp.AAC.1